MSRLLEQLRLLFVGACLIALGVVISIYLSRYLPSRQHDPHLAVELTGLLLGAVAFITAIWQRLALMASVRNGQVDAAAVLTAKVGVWLYFGAGSIALFMAPFLPFDDRIVAVGLALTYLGFGVGSLFFSSDLAQRLHSTKTTQP